jgi:hypothetical protein
MPARNIVVVCSGSHEKKVNLGEVFPTFPILLISSIKRLTWASVTGFKGASCPLAGLEVYLPVTVAPQSGAT